MAVIVGRALFAMLHLARGPLGPEAAALTVGATAAKIALGALRSRRGYAGPSWLLALMMISAGGAAEVLPLDATAELVVGIANATVIPAGAALLSGLFAKLILESAMPLLKMRLAPREAAKTTDPAKPSDPWSKTFIEARGGRAAAPA